MNQPSKHPFDWIVLRSHYVLRDRWLSVRADSCQTPSGELVEPFYVLEYSDWVNVVAVTPRSEVLLVREYRHGLGQTIIELPGGIVDSGEAAPLESARRELIEETGYGGGDFSQLCRLAPNPSHNTNSVYSFLATGVERQAEPSLDATEQMELLRVPRERVKEMLLSNEFIQSEDTSALFYAFFRLGWL